MVDRYVGRFEDFKIAAMYKLNVLIVQKVCGVAKQLKQVVDNDGNLLRHVKRVTVSKPKCCFERTQ